MSMENDLNQNNENEEITAVSLETIIQEAPVAEEDIQETPVPSSHLIRAADQSSPSVLLFPTGQFGQAPQAEDLNIYVGISYSMEAILPESHDTMHFNSAGIAVTSTVKIMITKKELAAPARPVRRGRRKEEEQEDILKVEGEPLLPKTALFKYTSAVSFTSLADVEDDDVVDILRRFEKLKKAADNLSEAISSHEKIMTEISSVGASSPEASALLDQAQSRVTEYRMLWEKRHRILTRKIVELGRSMEDSGPYTVQDMLLILPDSMKDVFLRQTANAIRGVINPEG